MVEITSKDFTPTWGKFVFGVFQLQNVRIEDCSQLNGDLSKNPN